MFTRRGDQLFCAIHPDVPISNGTTKLKKKWRLIQTCEACDQLVDELKRTKVTND